MYSERDKEAVKGTKHFTRIARDGPGELVATKIVTPTGTRGAVGTGDG
jgi:hypothetical protein